MAGRHSTDDDATEARPPGYQGEHRWSSALGRSGVKAPLVLVSGSLVVILVVFVISAMLPSEAALIPSAAASPSAGSTAGGSGNGPLATLDGGATGPSTHDRGPASDLDRHLAVNNPGPQTGAVGTAVRLAVGVTGATPGQRLSYVATGLPKGLSIDPDTGLITGKPVATATSTVTVTVSADSGAASMSFRWTIRR